MDLLTYNEDYANVLITLRILSDDAQDRRLDVSIHLPRSFSTALAVTAVYT